MAQYNGFTCDSCGKVIDPEERTKVTIRYEGKIIEGECFLDKCPDCVGTPPKDLKPLRRRKPSVT
jgi:hypothetical protein